MDRKTAEKSPDVLTVEEAGRRLGLCRNAAYLAAQRGELPALRFGRRIVVPRAAFEAMLAGGRTATLPRGA